MKRGKPIVVNPNKRNRVEAEETLATFLDGQKVSIFPPAIDPFWGLRTLFSVAWETVPTDDEEESQATPPP